MRWKQNVYFVNLYIIDEIENIINYIYNGVKGILCVFHWDLKPYCDVFIMYRRGSSFLAREVLKAPVCLGRSPGWGPGATPTRSLWISTCLPLVDNAK